MKKNSAFFFIFLLLATPVFSDTLEQAKVIGSLSKLSEQIMKETKKDHESFVKQANAFNTTTKEKPSETPPVQQALEEGKNAMMTFNTLKENLAPIQESIQNLKPQSNDLNQAFAALKEDLEHSRELIQSDIKVLELIQKDIAIRLSYADQIHYNEKGELMAPNQEVYDLYSKMQEQFKRVRKSQIKLIHLLKVDHRKFNAALKSAHQDLSRQILSDSQSSDQT